MIENSYQMYQNIFIKDYKSEILSQGNLGLYFSKLPILDCIWGLRTEDCIWTRLLRSRWMMLFFFVNEDEFDFCLIFSRGIFLLSRCQCWENWWQSSSALVLQCNVFLSILIILKYTWTPVRTFRTGIHPRPRPPPPPSWSLSPPSGSCSPWSRLWIFEWIFNCSAKI